MGWSIAAKSIKISANIRALQGLELSLTFYNKMGWQKE